MPKTLETPDFKDESEEALWWENNQAMILSEFEQASGEGTLARGTTSGRGQTPTITIRLDPGDLELARTQAKERGLRYQTYLKMILHQALVKEGPN